MWSRDFVIALLLSAALPLVALAADRDGSPARYQAVKHSPLPTSGTWAILDRDGARRTVPRYLSSLAGGEAGTGMIASPAFRIAVDCITLTVCGHDGRGGGHEKNYVALVDVRSGKTLHQVMAPGSDSMQERSWDVSPLRQREVRIEVYDSDAGNAYAWIGVGRIDAGPAFRVDFSRGMPGGWLASSPRAEPRTEILRGTVPFLRFPAEYTMIPAAGVCELRCGFAAERVFVLGCIAGGAKPAELYGEIEIVFRQGAPLRIPLICGYTLDTAGKMLSKSKAMYLHESSDPFQPYLVVSPGPEVMETIILRRNPKQDVAVCITAVTCQTQAAHENLIPLPDGVANAEEAAWIRSHTITATSPSLDKVMADLRRAHKLK